MRLSRRCELLRLTNSQLDMMREYCQQRGDILALLLYGSYGTPYQTPLSDIDLAVLPSPGVKWDFQVWMEIENNLADIAGNEDVNFLNLLRVPVTLQHRVLATGQALYLRSPIGLADFAEQVVKRHADFVPDLEAIYRDFDTAVRGEYCDS